MRFHPVPWTPERLPHPEIVEELVDAGLRPAGCLVDDLDDAQADRLVRGYDGDARAQLLAQLGRPCPVLASADGTTLASVSDLFGMPSVRMRTFLADGSLVETERRWSGLPPWPGRMAPFRRFTSVEREMARCVAPGRTLLISTDAPAGQLEEHRRQVARVSAARGAAPVPYAGMDGVAAGWNAAFAHEQAVVRRTDLAVGAALVVVMVLVLFALDSTGWLDGPWWPAVLLVLVAVTWWVTPGLVVVLRRRITWRPAFRSGAGGVP